MGLASPEPPDLAHHELLSIRFCPPAFLVPTLTWTISFAGKATSGVRIKACLSAALVSLPLSMVARLHIHEKPGLVRKICGV
eukprot:7681971-Alexandrium_andersonii.AAC.1